MLKVFASNMVGGKLPCGQVSPSAQVGTTEDRFRRRQGGQYLVERSGERWA